MKPTPLKQRLFALAARQWREWRGTVLFFVLVLVPVKSSLADWNWVPTGSMNPTILEGDLVFVNKLAYDLRFPLTLHRLGRWADPEKGDIVVLFSPADGARLVKRVIAAPGDAVEMRNQILYVNNVRLAYGPLAPEEVAGMEARVRERAVFAEEDLSGRKHAVMAIPGIASDKRSFSRLVVPEGKYFVMGDNRDNSTDSRSFGLADREQIIGEAKAVILSFNILDRYQPRLARILKQLK